MIASIAHAHDLILVTHNTREFIRVQGLRVEDWENAANNWDRPRFLRDKP